MNINKCRQNVVTAVIVDDDSLQTRLPIRGASPTVWGSEVCG